MPNASTDSPPKSPGPWQPRYGLGGMLLVMLVCSVMAAAGYYFVQSSRGGRPYQTAFIVLTLVAPLFLVVLMSNLLLIWRTRRRR